jgi:hypothetical protein
MKATLPSMKTRSAAVASARCDTGDDTTDGRTILKKAKRRTAQTPLNRTMSYKFQPLINRLVEKKGLEKADAEALYNDMLRFLYLCGTTAKTLAPSERIDLAWHEFLLFTREYQNFCRRMFGFFIHHNPRESGKRPVPSDGNSVIQDTLVAARAAFGDLSPNWDFPKSADFGCNYNCARCSTPSTSCDDA